MGIEIDTAIKEAITKNLSAEVGALLQARLKQADIDAEQVKNLQRTVADLKGEVTARIAAEKERDALCATAAAVEAKAEALRTLGLELSYREKLTVLREESAKERVGDLKEIVKTVFCSPVSKSRVTEYSNEPMMNRDGFQTGGSKTTQKTVESESTGPGLQAPT